MKAFTDQADFQIRFKPFQLYPELPRLDPEGVDKEEFFKQLAAQRNPESTEEQQKGGFKALQGAWKIDGLTLAERQGRLGNSFDAQRLIMLARNQGREDAIIEAIYTANHENNLCLSSMSVLLDCAKTAGVTGAEAMLQSDDLVKEVFSEYTMYKNMGINSVPFLVFNEKFPIHGAPDRPLLREGLRQLIEKGDNAPWPPKSPLSGMSVQDFVESAITLIHNLKENQRQEWSKVNQSLDWSNNDPRWLLLKEHLLSGGSVRAIFGEGPRLAELRSKLTSDVNPVWDLVIRRVGSADVSLTAATAA